jgi:hypothetical protein
MFPIFPDCHLEAVCKSDESNESINHTMKHHMHARASHHQLYFSRAGNARFQSFSKEIYINDGI